VSYSKKFEPLFRIAIVKDECRKMGKVEEGK